MGVRGRGFGAGFLEPELTPTNPEPLNPVTPRSSVPHALQKREPGGGSAPQDGHVGERCVPQPLQNADPGGAPFPQVGQITRFSVPCNVQRRQTSPSLPDSRNDELHGLSLPRHRLDQVAPVSQVVKLPM